MDGSQFTMQFTPAQSLIETGEALFHEVAPAERAKPTQISFMVGAVPDDLVTECWGVGFEWVHAQGVLEIEADMHWPYLLTGDGQPLDFSWANLHGGHLARIWRQKPVSRRTVQPHVLITGAGHEIFGHWLADFLPKLWLLDAAGYELAELRYVVPDDVPGYGMEMLRLCGISDDQVTKIRRDEVLSGRFLIPTTVHNGTRGPRFAEAAAFLTGRMGIVPRRSGIRLFLSRPAGDKRAPSNRQQVECAARSAGFSVVSPEHLSLLEQFRLVASADVVMGEYGSALHSTLFAGAGLIVCALRGTGLHPGFIQSAIGSALGQPTGYLFCKRELGDEPEGFTVPEDGLRQLLLSAECWRLNEAATAERLDALWPKAMQNTIDVDEAAEIRALTSRLRTIRGAPVLA